MEVNESSLDRIVRVVLEIVLIGAGLYLALQSGIVWGWLVAIVGLIPLVTGLVGFCPIYSLLKIRTAPKKA